MNIHLINVITGTILMGVVFSTLSHASGDVELECGENETLITEGDNIDTVLANCGTPLAIVKHGNVIFLSYINKSTYKNVTVTVTDSVVTDMN